MLDTRSISERISDLEHDNNVLRDKLSFLETNQSQIGGAFDILSQRIEKLISKVNEFVGRWGRIQ